MIPKMLCGLFALLLVAVGCGLAHLTFAILLPDIRFQAWLDAFHSGDPARVETCQDRGPVTVR